MSSVSILLLNLALILSLTTLLWLVSLPLKNASIVDPFWGAGFTVVAWSTRLLSGEGHWRSWLIVGLATLWGLRLSVYLLVRNAGHGEDRRYAAMRARVGEAFWRTSLFTVFLFQGLLIWLIGMPIQAGQLAPGPHGPFGPLDAAGILLFAVGLFFESVGDWQLSRFQADLANRGKVMQRGLWRYTRHPNYFGDFCVWWGMYLVAAAAGAAWTVFGPLAMSYFLLRVSGVALLERDIADRRPEYRRYQQTTSAFFPLPPRRSSPPPGAGEEPC
jgi:steroid 5-alpha reductase family enzyme